MKTVTTITLSVLTSLILVGCGSSDATSETSGTSTVSGQLVDNYVQNADYSCEDGKIGVTDKDGRFECDSLPVSFSLGGLHLGEIAKLAEDGQVFPQDLLGVSREDTNNSKVIAMARMLQSCDEDNNTVNGIVIPDIIKERLAVHATFEAENVEAYAVDANITLITEDEAHKHIEHTTSMIETMNHLELPKEVEDALYSSSSSLSQELLNTLSYMGNEERLAYDVYNKLYEAYPTLNQMKNIAQRAEYKHIQTVQALVQKYADDLTAFTNLNGTEGFSVEFASADIESMPAGIYNIDAITKLYDTLMTKGVQSEQDALEVGCMVEVVDINDLDADIKIAEESGAGDVVAAFNFLRNGSYAHYWAFDKGLKNMGVSEGCAILGDEYNHPEYPQFHQN